MSNLRADAFFLPGNGGNLFSLYYEPPTRPLKGCVLYIHPFAEEMNKSRRMVTLQAQAFASLGFAVMLVDLSGCGDSEGDFSGATWALWLNDIETAFRWLHLRTGIVPTLWGLRLGASLALEFSFINPSPSALLLWQPVLQGENFLTQFLRLKVANDMLSSEADKKSTQELKNQLNNGQSVEVAGYTVAPQLSKGIAQISIADMAPPPCTVYWIEVGADSERPLSPALKKVQEAWQARNFKLEITTALGEPFWNTPEITESPGVIAATCRFFSESKN